MADALAPYRAKRRFQKTPEPQGGSASAEAPIFVIQKHHARRMHYDLRLEIGGALKSWAVPEGPCLDPKVRRFAKLVEDHPLDYASFEGRIPSGEYGAGTVIVWDRGTWVTLADDPETALGHGELKFRVSGEKLSGGWTLVRLQDDPTNWLLIKERDPAARPLADYDVLAEEPHSVITGAPVDEAPQPPPVRKRAARPKPARIAGAKAAPMPSRWKPQLATLADGPPKGPGWLHEIKYDGYRTLAFLEDGKARLITRNGHDWTTRYDALSRACAKIPAGSAILDGEVVAQDARGVSSLDLLEQALSDRRTHDLTFFAFDLVHLDGFDLSACRLADRKRALEGLLAEVVDERSPVQLSEHVEGDGQALFAQASRLGLEGIVSKRADSPYVQARSAAWLKAKRVEIESFVVIGFLGNMPRSASSLLLAEEGEEGLRFVGRVGSGIGEAKSRELYETLAPLARETPATPVPRLPGARFVEPRTVAEVGHRGLSVNGAPRAPVFMGLTARPPPPARQAKARLVGDRDLAAVELTNPEREIFEGSGVSKLELALYYARVGDWALPEILRRPLTVIRSPSGRMADLFYQRHAFAGLPQGMGTIELSDDEGRNAFLTVIEPRGYLALPQFGAVELHLWGCHIDDPEHPDRIVIDLDPDETLAWPRVVEAAELCRARLERLGFEVFLRTTGGKGLHLLVALAGRDDWPMVKGFAAAFAKAMAADHPALFTAVAAKERRRGKIYVDYLRNGRGASAVASYSLRAKPGFPVATPIAWEELRRLSGPGAFTIESVPKRVNSLASDPWDDLGSSGIAITAKMRRDLGMKG